MEWVKEFKEISRHDAGTAGGKGASLGEMTQAGIPVPPGFVILAPAFQHFIEVSDINIEIDSILKTVDIQAMHTVENASATIQDLILSKKSIPQDIESEILSAFKSLGAEFVAVRSSATAEDSASAAWAGQLDSFLNTNEETLLENVRRCWASLFTPRAIFYRFEKGLDQTHISVAVVVQKMVNSDAAGIAFSVHPVTEDRNQIIIEAAFGLGEAVVSGQITPDSYVTTKEPRAILDINVVAQSRGLFRKQGGGNEWRELSEAEGKRQVLSDEQILTLSDTVVRIENHYGFPCDIEWAKEGGDIYIVQSRPITTLTEVALTKKDQFAVVAKDFHSPLVRNEIWVNLGFLWPELFNLPQPQLGIYSVHDQISYYLDLESWSAAKEKLLERVTQNPEVLAETISKSEVWGQEMNTFTEGCNTVSISSWSDSEKLVFYKKFASLQTRQYAVGVLLPLIDIAGVSFLETYTRAYLTERLPKGEVEEAFALLTTPTKNSFALDQEEALLRLAVKKLSGAELDRALEEHAKEYGWVYYVYTGPAFTRAEFKAFLNDYHERGIDPKGELERRAHEREHLLLDKQKLFAKLQPSASEQKLLELVSEYVWSKPRRKDYQSKSYYHLEPFFKYLAEKLQVSLRHARSLTQSQIKAVLSGESVDVKELEKQFEVHVAFSSTDGLNIYSGENAKREFAERVPPTGRVEKSLAELQGSVAFRGHARGVVRIINTPEDIHKMKRGDVLVSVATTPSIVLAMKLASAIVSDEGGLTCHAAIVSRELRIPCVVGTKIATQILKDGDLVEVDADNGIVRILSGGAGIEGYIGVTDDWYRSIARPNLLFDASMFLDVYREGVVPGATKNFEYQILLYKKGFSNFFRSKGQIDDLLNTTLLEAAKDTTAIAKYAKKGLEAFALADACIAEVDAVTTFKELQTFGPKVVEAMRESIQYGTLVPYWIMNAVEKAGYTREKPGAYEHIFKEFDVLRADSRNVNLRELVYEKMWLVLAKHFDVSTPEIFSSLTYKEFLTLLETEEKPDIELLTKRHKGCVVWYPKDSKELSYSFDEDIYEKIFRFDAKDFSGVELKGSIAQKGKVQGRVRILFTNADGAGFEDGDIVVSTSTSPNLMPFLMRCGAIVTDEGGIASHAAIVSRELKKPCVIGTKLATQVLKDGDLVEVDANNGVVRILNQRQKVVLSKIFSREKPLMYFSMWNDSDRMGYREFLGHTVRNNVFIVPPHGKKGTVWYSETELAEVASSLKQLSHSPDFLDKIMSRLTIEWSEIAPYLEEKKSIETVSDYEHYYLHLITWWSAMTASFELPNMPDVPAHARNAILEFRTKSEKFTEKMSRLLVEYWKRAHPDLADLAFFVTPTEVSQLGQKFDDKLVETLRGRKNGCVMVNGVVRPLADLDAVLSSAGLSIVDTTEKGSEIKGTPAQKGKAQGRVRKILTFADLGSFLSGEVLVTEMTNPEYVPVMKVAAAVVTDEGGATCHAAIASRELGVPCIVGTRNASSALNNGDLVEVDADNGIVRILQTQSPTAKDYQRLFYWPGEFSYFLSSYFMCIYSKLGAISLQDGTKWLSFIPLTTKTKTLQEGLDIYSSKEKYEALQSGLIDGYSKLVNQFEKALALPVLKKQDVESLFSSALAHYTHYSRTEFFYTDLAYEKSSQYPQIEANFKTFEDLKLKGREYLNTIALVPGSYLEQLLIKIAQQFDLSLNTLKQYSIEEVTALFDGVRVAESLLVERSKYFMMGTGKTFDVEVGTVAQEKISKFLSGIKEVKEMSGQVASKGVVTARARVFSVSLSNLHSTRELIDAMQEGEVLIAETTAPEIILACKKASAIVTNQGGMMSHAAIVSREMKIPCVVGVGNATDMIKTGDLVEVDADKGIVRVLETVKGKMKVAVTRHYVPLMSDLFMSGYTDVSNHKKVFFVDNFVRSGYINGKYYYGEDATEFGEILYRREEGESGFLLKVFHNIYAIGDEVAKLADDLVAKDLTILSDAELTQLFQTFSEKYKTFSVSLIGYNIQFPVERKVRELLRNRTSESEDLAVLTFPNKKNFAALEHENILRIGVDMERGKDVSSLINNHIATYGWINTRGGLGELWSSSEVQDSVIASGPKYEEQLHELSEYESDMRSKQRVLELELGLNERQLGLVAVARELVYYRTYRTDYLNMIFCKARPLLFELARRIGLSYEDLLHLRIDEILQRGVVPQSEIEERKRGYALLAVAPHQIVFSSDQAEIVRIKDRYCEDEIATSDTLRGNPAFTGLVRGRAKIVITKNDLPKVEVGDILVAPMTTPDMVPAMQRAVGFVTDEGGITCHAAIVSREMKKPCVIATKFATQVLKDGDMIEVDANSGVVRIITN